MIAFMVHTKLDGVIEIAFQFFIRQKIQLLDLKIHCEIINF